MQKSNLILHIAYYRNNWFWLFYCLFDRFEQWDEEEQADKRENVFNNSIAPTKNQKLYFLHFHSFHLFLSSHLNWFFIDRQENGKKFSFYELILQRNKNARRKNKNETF